MAQVAAESGGGAATAASKDDANKNAPKVGFMELFRFAEGNDVTVLCVGLFFAVIAGATQPALMVMYVCRLSRKHAPFAVMTLAPTARA